MNILEHCQTLLGEQGFCFLPAADAIEALDLQTATLPVLRAQWQDMPRDEYMADAGRYRRRRYAVMNAHDLDDLVIEPEQPHYQSLQYNRLNGGIERWFAPISSEVLAHPVVRRVLGFALDMLNQSHGRAHWHIEAHQFRIEAGRNSPGKPTPEGVHRDGVDYVLVMLIERQNIQRGTTTIHAPDGRLLDAFVLTDPFDLVVLNDHRCLHGVTPVSPLLIEEPAWRDVLVLTFRAL
ncbi:hypothetical protein C7S18_04940 [Ahniella affigens]|uniref:2OG-Fe dioxygenase family protein n=1 Tax=Ahniella affigens TaxID=2021234 RepID=A0A2P1PYU0_9GAMM|nr:2OG-Fe dioxygenase family protein [Ahniella affigens]AVQ00001.1 hypothetical protein C7S18_04940 [Ahniella affigens]